MAQQSALQVYHRTANWALLGSRGVGTWAHKIQNVWSNLWFSAQQDDRITAYIPVKLKFGVEKDIKSSGIEEYSPPDGIEEFDDVTLCPVLELAQLSLLLC